MTDDRLTLLAAPRISLAQWTRVLQAGTSYGPSPATAAATALYRICIDHGVDPAIALAFAAHEHQYLTDPKSVVVQLKTNNWGSVRVAYDAALATGQVQTAGGSFATYATLADALTDWCKRMRGRYVQERGLTTVDAAIPVYAPASDGNTPQRYIDHVYELVARWRREEEPMAGFELPDEPEYLNDAGQNIYMLSARWKDPRDRPGDVHLLVIHHTGGVDSREYLSDPFRKGEQRKVSTHYLVGEYDDAGGLRVYKYGSEAKDSMWCQGHGTLGGLARERTNCNEGGISIELEGPPISDAVQRAGARLAWSILRYWKAQGRTLLLIRHRDLDPAKVDPQLDWDAFCRIAYAGGAQ